MTSHSPHTSILGRVLRLARCAAWFIPALLCLAPLAQAQTAADIAPAALPGKTLSLRASFAGAPFQGTGILSISFTGTNNYTIPVSDGNPALVSGTWAAQQSGGVTVVILNGYLVNGATVNLALVPASNGAQTGSFEMYATGVNSSKSGTFTISGTSSGGGTGAPVVTSATTATATVGTPFSYQITASPAATSYTNTGGNAPVQINPTTGLVTGTFTTAGTFVFSFVAENSIGGTKPISVTVTVTGSSTGGVASYAGTYTGSILVATNGAAETVFTTFTGTVSTTGALVAQGGEVNGTVNASGVITFASNGLGMSTGSISATGVLAAQGASTVLGTTTRVFRIAATRGSGVATTTAPANLVGYRNKVGQIFQFTVTGTNTGAIWGSDVYTDDSSVSTAAVHAGVLAVGETKIVTLTILPGQSSYAGLSRNGVKSGAWGTWSGSYSFAGSGVIAGTSVATTRPAVATNFTATTSGYAVGGRLVMPINVIGGGSYTYQWYLNGLLISGATANPYVIESLATSNAGTYTVDVTNSLGTSRLTAGTITVGASGSPVISLQPLSKSVTPGGTFVLAISASGTGNSYQWFRNGTALPGETGQYLLRQNVTASDAGTYTVRITNSAGTITSDGGVITLSATASRPANISCRTNIAAGAIVTPGFVVQGTGTKNVLIRAVGPTLAGFGVAGTMADPQFKVVRQDTGATIATNDNWDASLASTMSAAGAFALTAGSKDAAAVVTLTAGQAYTVQVSGVGTSSGIALIEVYDIDTAPTSKLVNVSVRGQTGTGADVLILGLVIQGTGQRTLLVRGGGPALTGFGVQGAVADPRLEIFDSNSRSVLANDDWGSAAFVAELEQARQFVGAFAFTANSKDAATLALLDPGAYTIQVSGANNGTGEALVEVYEVP